MNRPRQATTCRCDRPLVDPETSDCIKCGHVVAQRKDRVMSCRRCKVCLTNWPAALKIHDKIESFLNCPECGEKTDFFTNASPIDESEARSRTLSAWFDKFYDEREAKQIAALEQAVKDSA